MSAEQNRNGGTSWKVIDACVPRGTTEKLARATVRSVESVNVWRRRRNGQTNKKFNPLELYEIILDHALAHAPQEAHRIHQYLERRYKSFFASIFGTKAPALTVDERDRELADVTREYSETLQCLKLIFFPVVSKFVSTL